jgi:hypothetical protein
VAKVAKICNHLTMRPAWSKLPKSMGIVYMYAISSTRVSSGCIIYGQIRNRLKVIIHRLFCQKTDTGRIQNRLFFPSLHAFKKVSQSSPVSETIRINQERLRTSACATWWHQVISCTTHTFFLRFSHLCSEAGASCDDVPRAVVKMYRRRNAFQI